jgi:hypothetical protein
MPWAAKKATASLASSSASSAPTRSTCGRKVRASVWRGATRKRRAVSQAVPSRRAHGLPSLRPCARIGRRTRSTRGGSGLEMSCALATTSTVSWGCSATKLAAARRHDGNDPAPRPSLANRRHRSTSIQRTSAAMTGSLGSIHVSVLQNDAARRGGLGNACSLTFPPRRLWAVCGWCHHQAHPSRLIRRTSQIVISRRNWMQNEATLDRVVPNGSALANRAPAEPAIERAGRGLRRLQAFDVGMHKSRPRNTNGLLRRSDQRRRPENVVEYLTGRPALVG